MNGWRYGPRRKSLSLFMYREPKAAKAALFSMSFPRHVDEYQQHLRRLSAAGRQTAARPIRYGHIHSGKSRPKLDMPITFAMLLTLVSSSNGRKNAETFMGASSAVIVLASRPQNASPILMRLVSYAIHYYRDFRAGRRRHSARPSEGRACGASTDLRDAPRATCRPTANWPNQIQGRGLRDRPARAIPRQEAARARPRDGKPGVSLEWFNMLYQVLLGQEKGPALSARLLRVYGLQNTVEMIDGRAGPAFGINAPGNCEF